MARVKQVGLTGGGNLKKQEFGVMRIQAGGLAIERNNWSAFQRFRNLIQTGLLLDQLVIGFLLKLKFGHGLLFSRDRALL